MKEPEVTIYWRNTPTEDEIKYGYTVHNNPWAIGVWVAARPIVALAMREGMFTSKNHLPPERIGEYRQALLDLALARYGGHERQK